jgi:hypothetical protein
MDAHTTTSGTRSATSVMRVQAWWVASAHEAVPGHPNKSEGFLRESGCGRATLYKPRGSTPGGGTWVDTTSRCRFEPLQWHPYVAMSPVSK